MIPWGKLTEIWKTNGVRSENHIECLQEGNPGTLPQINVNPANFLGRKITFHKKIVLFSGSRLMWGRTMGIYLVTDTFCWGFPIDQLTND